MSGAPIGCSQDFAIDEVKFFDASSAGARRNRNGFAEFGFAKDGLSA
jgi:hypothetical protein